MSICTAAILSLSLSLPPTSHRRPVLRLPPVDLLPLSLFSPTFFLSLLSHLSCTELLHIPSARSAGLRRTYLTAALADWAVVAASAVGSRASSPSRHPHPHLLVSQRIGSRWAHFKAFHHCLSKMSPAWDIQLHISEYLEQVLV